LFSELNDFAGGGGGGLAAGKISGKSATLSDMSGMISSLVVNQNTH
jgi:hypothetical protein